MISRLKNIYITIITLVLISLVLFVVALWVSGIFTTSEKPPSPAQLRNQIVVNQDNAVRLLGGTIDSTKSYFIDGVIDMGDQAITVPPGGIEIAGFSFDISKLISSADNYEMFVSAPSSGNVLMSDIDITVSGSSSQVFDLIDSDGLHAFEINRVNFTNCTSLGQLENYRQGLEIGTGRFGGSPSLILAGEWLGGYRLTTSIARSMPDLATSLFRAGAGFTMYNRFLTDIHCDLPASPDSGLLDFNGTEFPKPGMLDINGAIITRDGVSDPNDIYLTPNITAGNLASYWKNNVGLPNTFVGGKLTITAEIQTTIGLVNEFVNMNGTFTPSDMEHFDSPANGQLRQLGTDPREYVCYVNLILDGGDTDVYTVRMVVVRNVGGATEVVNSQMRVINSFNGSRDVAYYSYLFNVKLNFHDIIYMQVANNTDTTNCTLELDSAFTIGER